MSEGRRLSYERTQFVVVKIPVTPGQDDMLHTREERIDQALQAKGIGTVLGWGGSLGPARPHGLRAVAFTRIDLEVADMHVTRTELHTLLPGIDAPERTEIHYAIDGTGFMDVYTADGWQLQLPVTRGT